MVTVQVIAFIFGAVLILIAIIGGGFTIKELIVPEVPRKGRIGSGIVGVLFIAYSILAPPAPSSPSADSPRLPPASTPGTATIYADDQPYTSNDGIEVSSLTATSDHNPPQLNDHITVQFLFRNTGQQPVTLEYIFIGARDPAKTPKDFGEFDANKVLKSGEKTLFRSSILVNKTGIWTFFPCYLIGENYCPDTWRAFQVNV